MLEEIWVKPTLKIKKSRRLNFDVISGYTTKTSVVLNLSNTYKPEEYVTLDCHIMALLAHESRHVIQYHRDEKIWVSAFISKSFEDIAVLEFEAYLVSALTINGMYFRHDEARDVCYPVLSHLIYQLEKKLQVPDFINDLELNKTNFKIEHFREAVKHSLAYASKDMVKVRKVANLLLKSVKSLVIAEEYHDMLMYNFEESSEFFKNEFRKTVRGLI